MLHRTDEQGIIAISQPAHAWVSGQLAKAWDSSMLVPVTEEVCLAAELHDVGFLQWERHPTLNPATGLPHTFMDMPREMHFEIWTTSIQQMLRFGRYPALLVSMHFTSLARRNEREGTPAEKTALGQFLEQQEALQTTLRTSLSNDAYYGPTSTGDILRRNQTLVSPWDWMSLLLCHCLAEPKVIAEIPGALGHRSLTLTPLDRNGSRIAVGPWPFRPESVALVCEGRRLLQRYENEVQMRQAFRAAAPVVIHIELVPQVAGQEG